MPTEDKKEILEAIGSLNIRFDGLSQTVNGLTHEVGGLSQKIDDLTELVENTAVSTANGFHEVYEQLAQMATKDELLQVKTELSDKMTEVETKLSSKIDNLQNRQDVFAGLDRKVDQLTTDIVKVKKVVGIS